jgi:hypothetical protein
MEMLNKIKLYIYVLLSIPLLTLAQNKEDSLLKQISNIEVELNSPVEAEENLYLNTVSFQSFYDVLSPMGEWIQVSKEDVDEDLNDGEGQSYSSLAEDENFLFIWKPTADASWKPYMNGKWVYTNHGWLWQSYDAWGNATYNYGRWWNSKKYGWVWMPGYAWAPAWVRWKVSADYVGWAPLTPKAKWSSEKGINSGNYKYNDADVNWVFVQKEGFVNDLNSSNVAASNMNKDLVAKSESIIDIKLENEAVTNIGPDVADIEKRCGKKIGRKYLKFTRERNRFRMGDNDVVLTREDFTKYNTNLTDGKGKTFDKPKKFKRSDRVKKMIKKRWQHRKKIRGRQ